VVSYHWNVYYWLRCRVLLGELYAKDGRRSEAEAIAREMRALLSVADTGHPLRGRVAQLGVQ
jgi:hypothetical protein